MVRILPSKAPLPPSALFSLTADRCIHSEEGACIDTLKKKGMEEGVEVVEEDLLGKQEDYFLFRNESENRRVGPGRA